MLNFLLIVVMLGGVFILLLGAIEFDVDGVLVGALIVWVSISVFQHVNRDETDKEAARLEEEQKVIPVKINDIDGCSTYRFYDKLKYHYFTNCEQKGN